MNKYQKAIIKGAKNYKHSTNSSWREAKEISKLNVDMCLDYIKRLPRFKPNFRKSTEESKND